MDEESKRKLQELWDFMSELHDKSAQRIQSDAAEVMDVALRKFEELFSKEINE